VVGIITSSDLTRWLRRWRALDGRALDSRALDSRALDGRALDGRERDGGERDGRAHQPDKPNLDRW